MSIAETILGQTVPWYRIWHDAKIESVESCLGHVSVFKYADGSKIIYEGSTPKAYPPEAA